MKKHFYLLKTFLCVFAAGVLVGCSDDEGGTPQLGEGEGALRLEVEAATAFEVATRAIDEDEYNNTDNYNIKITSVANGGVVAEGLLSEIEFPLSLTVGAYDLIATYGDEYKDANSTRDGFYVEGKSTIQIESGKTAQAKVTCSPATAAKLTVVFDEALDEYFSDYSAEFTTTALTAESAKAIWLKADTDPLYLKVNDNEKIISTLTFTPKSDSNVKAQTITIDPAPVLSPGQWYEITVKPKESTSQDGTLKLTITINYDDIKEEEVDITIPSDWL